MVMRWRQVLDKVVSDEIRAKQIMDIWEMPPLSQEDARQEIVALGTYLADNPLPKEGEDVAFEDRVARLSGHFKQKRPSSTQVWYRIWKSFLLAIVPWRASRLIRNAERFVSAQAPYPGKVDLRTYGAFLVSESEALSKGTLDRAPELDHSELADVLDGWPIDPRYSIPTLHVLMTESNFSDERLLRWGSRTAFVLGVVAVAFVVPWGAITSPSSAQLQVPIAPGLASLLLLALSLLTLIVERCTRFLDEYGVATAKTFNRAISGVMILSALVLAVGVRFDQGHGLGAVLGICCTC